MDLLEGECTMGVRGMGSIPSLRLHKPNLIYDIIQQGLSLKNGVTILTSPNPLQLLIREYLHMLRLDQWIRNITPVSNRWQVSSSPYLAVQPCIVKDPKCVPGVHNSPGQETDTLDGKETVHDLRGNFNPKALEVGVVQVDPFGEEEDNGGSPEHDEEAIDCWYQWNQHILYSRKQEDEHSPAINPIGVLM
jgi:hypothetical protein